MGLFNVFKSSKKKAQNYTLKDVTPELSKELDEQDKQLKSIHDAESKFESTGDIDALIAFWEKIWAQGGLLFNGSKWTFRLPDLYIKQKRYDDALKVVKKIKNPSYQDKATSYIEKIQNAKARQNK